MPGFNNMDNMLREMDLNLVFICTPSGVHPQQVIKAASYQATSVYGFGHPLYFRNVVDVVRGMAEPETDGREGLKSMEVLVAANLSARDHKTVSLPLEY